MPLSSEIRASYEVVLRDLETDRARVYEEVATLQRSLKELDYNIASLQRRLNPNSAPLRALAVVRDPAKKYANISVRWAMLDLLNDSGPLATADIADALKSAGVMSRAINFTNNVSAVLSTTMKEHDEVKLDDGKWQLTETGRNAIAHIRASGKFRRACPWSAALTAGTVGAA